MQWTLVLLLVTAVQVGCSGTPGLRDYTLELLRTSLAQGVSESFLLDRGRVQHRTGMVTANPRVETVEPSLDRWAAYWAEVDRIGVWAWQLNYVDNSKTGLGNWYVRVGDGDRFVAARGRNAFPPDGQFDALMQATRRLVEEDGDGVAQP